MPIELAVDSVPAHRPLDNVVVIRNFYLGHRVFKIIISIVPA